MMRNSFIKRIYVIAPLLATNKKRENRKVSYALPQKVYLQSTRPSLARRMQMRKRNIGRWYREPRALRAKEKVYSKSKISAKGCALKSIIVDIGSLQTAVSTSCCSRKPVQSCWAELVASHPHTDWRRLDFDSARAECCVPLTQQRTSGCLRWFLGPIAVGFAIDMARRDQCG